MTRDMEMRLVDLAGRFVAAFEQIAHALDRAYPVTWTTPTPGVPAAPYVPQVPTPYPYPVGDPLGWPIYPKITCESNIRSTASGVQAYNAKGGMTQADGQGDDSGTRGG